LFYNTARSVHCGNTQAHNTHTYTHTQHIRMEDWRRQCCVGRNRAQNEAGSCSSRRRISTGDRFMHYSTRSRSTNIYASSMQASRAVRQAERPSRARAGRSLYAARRRCQPCSAGGRCALQQFRILRHQSDRNRVLRTSGARSTSLQAM